MNFYFLLPEAAAFGVLVVSTLTVIARSEATKQSQGWLRPFGARNDGGGFLLTLSFAGIFLVLISLLPLAGKEEAAFGGMFILDPLAAFFKAFFTLVLAVVICMSSEFFPPPHPPLSPQGGEGKGEGEFLLILWTSLLGLFFLVSANDFLLLFISLEIFTLSLYILAAYLKHSLVSIEAGLKYLILGSLASAFLIYGISLLYVAAGSTGLPDIREAFRREPHNRLILLGMLFIISGLGFKVASVPFQLWVPDVYEGAPTPVVAYLSVASKGAGFALLLRLLFTVFIPFDSGRVLLFSGLAAMTLVYGNLGALVQTNIKRLFGYSSIGHAGYLLIGIAAGKEAGTSAVIYYLMAYAVSNLAAFLVITVVSRGGVSPPDAGRGDRAPASDRIDACRGLAKRSPFLAGTFFVALLSLAGVPPLAGFFGKFLILLAAVRSNLEWIALLGALAVAVSLFYYLTLVRVMYFEEPNDASPLALSPFVKFILILLVLSIFALGLWQAPFFAFSLSAARSLF